MMLLSCKREMGFCYFTILIIICNSIIHECRTVAYSNVDFVNSKIENNRTRKIKEYVGTIGNFTDKVISNQKNRLRKPVFTRLNLKRLKLLSNGEKNSSYTLAIFKDEHPKENFPSHTLAIFKPNSDVVLAQPMEINFNEDQFIVPEVDEDTREGEVFLNNVGIDEIGDSYQVDQSHKQQFFAINANEIPFPSNDASQGNDNFGGYPETHQLMSTTEHSGYFYGYSYQPPSYLPPMENGAYLPPKLNEGYLPPAPAYLPPEPTGGYLPPKPTEGYLPPKPTKGYLPPKPAEGYLPPTPTEGYLPPNPNGAYLPPKPAEGYLPPKPTEGYLPPKPAEGYLPPTPTEGYLPPNPNGAYLPPKPTEGYLPPKPTEGHLPPKLIGGYLPPKPTEGYLPPNPNGAYLPPSLQGAYLPPAENGVIFLEPITSTGNDTKAVRIKEHDLFAHYYIGYKFWYAALVFAIYHVIMVIFFHLTILAKHYSKFPAALHAAAANAFDVHRRLENF